MIAETIIVCVTAVTITGTWLGLRFARNIIQPPLEQERAEALALVQKCISENCGRNRVLALLATRPELLPDDVRKRALQWHNGEGLSIPMSLDKETP